MLPILFDLSDEEKPPDREGAGFWVRALARGIDTLVQLAVGPSASPSTE